MNLDEFIYSFSTQVFEKKKKYISVGRAKRSVNEIHGEEREEEE